MGINQENFIKGKRFTEDFVLDDAQDQVIMKEATPTRHGVVSTGDQTFAGNKTFQNDVTAKIVYADMFIGQDGRINDIGVAGTAGFGVGICPNPPAGVNPLSNGTYVRGDKDYGNYIDASGSVMIWVPLFYYKIATNAVTIKSEYDFASVAAANAAGFAVHRAFYDGGLQRGFFIDKYSCSNKNGVFASVRGGIPVDTDGSQSGVGAINGCGGVNNYGMIQNAAKSRGANYHAASLFMHKAAALLSLAHGQAVTSTDYCAWYDPAANFPKGCNNNALGDVNDATLTFTSAGHGTYPAKPLAGSASNLAKVTHNGQECGIADMNGTMWEVAPGLTSDGTNYYMLKPSVRLRNLIGSDATSANSLFGSAGLANYDNIGSVAGVLNASQSAKLFGSAGQTLSSDASGTNWSLTGAGIPLAAGGTNEFGNDGIWDWRFNEMCPIVGADGYYGSYAGVWALDLNTVRLNAYYDVGGRSALYL